MKAVVLGSGGVTTGDFDENGEMTSWHSTHKTKVFGPQNPKNDKNDENGGCHSGKTMVSRKRGFHNSDFSDFNCFGVLGLLRGQEGHKSEVSEKGLADRGGWREEIRSYDRD